MVVFLVFFDGIMIRINVQTTSSTERTPKMGLPWQEFLLSTPAARGSKT